MEETISLKELLETLKKRLVLIVSITLLTGIVSGLVSYLYLTPIYQSSTQLLINQTKNNQSTVNSSDIQVQANLQLINTYNVIIKSPAILDKVAEKLNSGITAGQLNGQISVGNEANSQVVTITVKDANAKQAAQIANTTAEVFQSEIVKIMNVNNVNILAEATENPTPVAPNPVMNIAIAILVGLILGIGLAFLLEYFNSTIKNEQDVDKILGLPILGVIATIDDQKMEEAVARRAGRKSSGRGEDIGA